MAFDIKVKQLEARWKLSQECLPQEREAIVAALGGSADSVAIALAGMLRPAQLSE